MNNLQAFLRMFPNWIAFAIDKAAACPTGTMIVRAETPVGVLFVKQMAVFAMHYARWATGARDVNASRNSFKMIRSNTPTMHACVATNTGCVGIVAKMIDLEVVGNRANGNFIGKAMCFDSFAIETDLSVSATVTAAKPYPAFARLVDASPKPFSRWQSRLFRSAARWGAKFMPSQVMGVAPAARLHVSSAVVNGAQGILGGHREHHPSGVMRAAVPAARPLSFYHLAEVVR